MKILKCKYCGQTFYSEYGEDGYIDHVENFSENSFFKHNELDEIKEDLLDDIVMHGNDIRSTMSIKSRCDCFLTWSHASGDLKKEVKDKVDQILTKLETAQEKADSVFESLSPLEKYYIAQKNIEIDDSDIRDELNLECEES